MKPTMRHLTLGISTGVTAFAIVVPLIHLLVALLAVVGLVVAPWDNPVEVFLFLMTASAFAVFPWGLWIALTDARTQNMFNEDHEVAEYVLGAMGVFLTLTFLVCTRLQFVYAQFRWFITPILLACGAALLCWRWRKVWGFPLAIGLRRILDYAIPADKKSHADP
jgi:hypothetical protein